MAVFKSLSTGSNPSFQAVSSGGKSSKAGAGVTPGWGSADSAASAPVAGTDASTLGATFDPVSRGGLSTFAHAHQIDPASERQATMIVSALARSVVRGDGH